MASRCQFPQLMRLIWWSEERERIVFNGLSAIFEQLWGWEPNQFCDALAGRLAQLKEEQTRVEFWIGSKQAHLREETKDDRKTLPRPHSREVIELGIILAMLVPLERQDCQS